MFYRIGKIKCEEGKADEVIGVAVWENKESLDSNAERVQSMMAGLMKYVISPPEISEGILEYQFNNK